jgi:hypothetical protein
MDWRRDPGGDLDGDSRERWNVERNDGAVIDMDTSHQTARM